MSRLAIGGGGRGRWQRAARRGAFGGPGRAAALAVALAVPLAVTAQAGPAWALTGAGARPPGSRADGRAGHLLRRSRHVLRNRQAGLQAHPAGTRGVLRRTPGPGQEGNGGRASIQHLRGRHRGGHDRAWPAA